MNLTLKSCTRSTSTSTKTSGTHTTIHILILLVAPKNPNKICCYNFYVCLYSFLFLSSLQHSFCRHQGLHLVVHEPVGPGPGPNLKRALWTLWPTRRCENSNSFFKKQHIFPILLTSSFVFSLVPGTFNITGAPLPADKDTGRLLLLRVRGPWATACPRPPLCWVGPGHDQHHSVSLNSLQFFFTSPIHHLGKENVLKPSIISPTCRFTTKVYAESAELWHGHEDWDPLGLRPVWGAGPAEMAVWRLVLGREHRQHAGSRRHSRVRDHAIFSWITTKTV